MEDHGHVGRKLDIFQLRFNYLLQVWVDISTVHLMKPTIHHRWFDVNDFNANLLDMENKLGRARLGHNLGHLIKIYCY